MSLNYYVYIGKKIKLMNLIIDYTDCTDFLITLIFCCYREFLTRGLHGESILLSAVEEPSTTLYSPLSKGPALSHPSLLRLALR
jgi:hypothetical protein